MEIAVAVARIHLRVDLDDVDGVVEYSDEFSVSVRSVEPVNN